jgi:hypothetical protein|tara:strand:+ start:464 stop:1084 length:621 start_codon:yes stop_codon:yes gene_type:complete
MQIKVKDNINRVMKGLSDDQKKQIPFATAQAINATLGIGKQKNKGLDREYAKQMVKKLDRPRPQTTKAFYRKRATKRNQVGELGLQDWANNVLKYQIDGGVRSGNRKIPVPITATKRLNKFGNIAGKRSGLVKGSQEFIGTIGETSGVWKKNKGQTPTLLIKFHDTVEYTKKPFKFYKIARNYIKKTFDRQLTKALRAALKTAKSK